MRTRGRSLHGRWFIAPLLLLALAGCNDDEDGTCRPCTEDGQPVAATIASWDPAVGVKVRAYFWYGTHVTDPRNLVLGETIISNDGSFAMRLPEVPGDLLTGREVPASYADSSSISVSNFTARKSNFVEFSIFDSTGTYRYMLYRSSASQDSTTLPFTFGYYVYFSDAVVINGRKNSTVPGYYDPSGAWIVKPVHDHYLYASVHFQAGWNVYALRTVSTTMDSSKVERWFEVYSGNVPELRWHRFYRPDLEPSGFPPARSGAACPTPGLGAGPHAVAGGRPDLFTPWRGGTADRPPSRPPRR